MPSIERRIGELERKEGIGLERPKIIVRFVGVDGETEIRIARPFGGGCVLYRETGEPLENFYERAFSAFGTTAIAVSEEERASR